MRAESELTDLQWLARAVNVRAEWGDAWQPDKLVGITRRGLTRHRVTPEGLMHHVGSDMCGRDVFRLRREAG